MILKDEIIDNLNYKIEEIYYDFQSKLGITSGDINPWDALEQDKLIEQLAELMEKVLNYEKEER